MYGVMALYNVSLLYYQKTMNSAVTINDAVNRNLASVINNWNDCSNCFYELVKSYIYICMINVIYQHELLIWFKVKITNNCFNFIGDKSLKVVSATFLLVYFVCLKGRTCETRKNVLYFTSKALFFLEIIKF